MRLKRDVLKDHLQRVSCGGQIKEVIFGGAFAANALTADHMLLVLAPGLDGVDELEEEVGVGDLGLLMKALSMVPGSDDDIGVAIRIEDKRLVIDEEGRGCVRLMTAAPRTIATRIEPKIIEGLMAKIGGTTVPLTSGLVNGVKAAYAGLKATEAEVIVGPTGGMIRIGDASSHVAEFPCATLVAPEQFSLNFGEHLIAVMSCIGPEAVLYLAGPNQQIAIQDLDYNYLLMPRAVGADRKGKKVAKAASPESTPTAVVGEQPAPVPTPAPVAAG